MPSTELPRDVIGKHEVIGEIEYYEAKDSGDGVVNEPANIGGTIWLKTTTLERMVTYTHLKAEDLAVRLG
jgi:hypothetical protein